MDLCIERDRLPFNLNHRGYIVHIYTDQSYKESGYRVRTYLRAAYSISSWLFLRHNPIIKSRQISLLMKTIQTLLRPFRQGRNIIGRIKETTSSARRSRMAFSRGHLSLFPAVSPSPGTYIVHYRSYWYVSEGGETIVEGATRAENRNVYSVLRKATGDLSVMEQTCHYISQSVVFLSLLFFLCVSVDHSVPSSPTEFYWGIIERNR